MKPIIQSRARIAWVDQGSRADEAGIRAGDLLISVNGHPIRDIIDYEYHVSSFETKLVIQRPSGERVEIVFNNDYDPRLGLGFDELVFDGEKHCANKCIFCFIDQLPEGMRDTLYFKDDDYRLSFLQGNFVTLSNVGEADLQRILDMRLAPLYISVHSTDDMIRRKLLGRRRTSPIMTTLRRLAEARIHFHSQVVLVPGVNDGEALDRTIKDLWSLWPACASVGVVPVGLTAHRQRLPELTPVTAEIARGTLEIVHSAQKTCASQSGTHFVYGADEFYSLACLPFPPAEAYDGYPQIENGIGLARLFCDEFADIEARLPMSAPSNLRSTVVTGVLGAHVIRDACNILNQIQGLNVMLLPVANRFFGDSVTVSGLVVGSDIIESLHEESARGNLGDLVVIPDVMLRRGETCFLDDVTVDDIASDVGVRVVVARTSARGLVDSILPGCLNAR
ncbi:MAG: DUF512 domain-containing protein [Firmicutes bacterium]|jgi:putative radical SAM enzyme (TIGR03279 family)|nr:DUF512 domain-containing protein [Bacillota bacterium]MDD4336120.1 DUF512 domain-containing protein [Bacillota bacterium]MDD4792387.1 DUF512 domain-containing protein [Bacillota bacterium]